MTIAGLGTCLPEPVVTNDDLSLVLDTSDEWIRQRTGIRERRVVPSGVNASDLGIEAGREALRDAGLSPEDIDLVITASISPDQMMPAMASRVAYELGCSGAGAFDISAGCSGFVYGLAMASGAVASGMHEHVLIVGAEAISRIIDPEDRSTAILFGDGAGAVVVSPLGPTASEGDSVVGGPGRAPAGILGFDLGSDGSGGQFLTVPAGGSRLPASHETVSGRMHYLKMNGREVYRFATRVVSHSVSRVLAGCGRNVSEVDLFVPHQANLRIIDMAVKKLGMAAEDVYTNLQRYGNTSCASIPLCLSEARAEGRLEEGDLVLLMGFGAGLAWGACLLEWTQTVPRAGCAGDAAQGGEG